VVAAGRVVGHLLPHCAGDGVEGLPLAGGAAVVDQVAGLEYEGGMEAHHVFDDLAVNLVAIAGVAIDGEAEERH
jgi:hypothetical protein